MARAGRSKCFHSKIDWLWKIAYIFNATVITVSVLTGGIIMYLIVFPYIHERDFEPNTCQIIAIAQNMPILKCENRCSRESSFFPCLRVTVTYITREGERYNASLFDSIETHEHYWRYGCVTHSCHHRLEENLFVISLFRTRLQATPKFSCFVSSMRHGNEALMHKWHRPTSLFYGIFIPSSCFVISLTAILCLSYYNRCRVWDNDVPLIA